MARRMIECKTWKSYQVGQLNYRQRCLWIGLITAADDQGRAHAHPGVLRGQIFPYDDISHDDLQDDIDHLAELDLIHLYENDDGAPLYQIVNWWRYQRPTWAWPSDLPAPEGWSDRERYRKGNRVVETRWDRDGGFTSDDSETTVGPLRDQSETSDSSSSSYRDRYSSSGSIDATDDHNPFTLYEQATASTLTQIIAERIGDMIDECEEHRQRLSERASGASLTGDEWVCAAIREASASTNKFGLRYVGAILDRWMEEGYDSDKVEQKRAPPKRTYDDYEIIKGPDGKPLAREVKK